LPVGVAVGLGVGGAVGGTQRTAGRGWAGVAAADEEGAASTAADAEDALVAGTAVIDAAGALAEGV